MKHKLVCLCLILWLAFAMPLTAAAAEFNADRLGSVSVTLLEPEEKTPIQGVQLALYYVATVSLNGNGNLSYVYTDGFDGCGVALDDPTLTAVLDAYVGSHPAVPRTAVTDEQGTAVFANLPLGLYFVKQTNVLEDYAPCKSFLVTVPNTDESGYVYDVNASPKTEIAKLTDITVKKVWNVGEHTGIADHVTVQLLREKTVIETSVLNNDNNWQVVYYDMPMSDDYSIQEINVPKGFAATYTEKDYTFTVINTYKLPQTGQLVWPIPVLALAGLALLTVGTALLRRVRNGDD